MKILHLVLYSHNVDYDNMYNITSAYYQQFDNVKTVYYCYEPGIASETILNGNILCIKGSEAYNSQIMEKTLRAFEFFSDQLDEYDYVIRSNISTIINFEKLDKELSKLEKLQYAGKVMELRWIDYSAGINDSTHFGTHYVSGISIIFSIKLIRLLLEYKDTLNRVVIDDVAFGIFAKEHNIAPTTLNYHVAIMENFNGRPNDMETFFTTNPQFIFYRNRVDEHYRDSREVDVQQMKKIVEFLNREKDK